MAGPNLQNENILQRQAVSATYAKLSRRYLIQKRMENLKLVYVINISITVTTVHASVKTMNY